MTIAGLWRYGDWRYVATGCTSLVQLSHANVSDTGSVKLLLNTFTATAELSRQLICCHVRHSQVYLSVSSCNVMVHRRCSRPPAGATVGLFDWCSAVEENGQAVNALNNLPEVVMKWLHGWIMNYKSPNQQCQRIDGV